jgi:hypothetical protein
VVFPDGAVDDAHEVDQVLLDALFVADVLGLGFGAGGAIIIAGALHVVGEPVGLEIDLFFAGGDVAELDGVEGVLVAFEEADAAGFEAEDLVAAGGLEDADEGFGAEGGVDGDGVLNGELGGEGEEEVGGAEDCHAVELVHPELAAVAGDGRDPVEQGGVFSPF